MERQEFELSSISGLPTAPLQPDIIYSPPKIIIKKNICKLLEHTSLMLKKNYLIMTRNKKITLFQLFSPVLICCLIIFWQYLANIITDYAEINPEITPTSKISRCIAPEFSNAECVTIGYGIAGPHEPWIDYVMKMVAEINDLEFGKDVKMLSSGTPLDFTHYLENNLNLTQIGVIFCTSEWPISSLYNLPCKFEQLVGQKLIFYSIVYNNSLLWKSPFVSNWKAAHSKDAYAFGLKYSIDNALFQYFSKDNSELDIKSDAKHIKMNITHQDYPKVVSRFYQGYDVAAQYGAFYFFMPYMISFIITVTEILREKEKKLRQGLSVMGLSSNPFWISWFITVLLINFLITIIMMISGTLFGFDFFIKTPILLIFIVLFTFGIAIQLAGFFITTICTDAKIGYTVSYSFLLMAIVMEFFFSNIFIVYFLHQDNIYDWCKAIRLFFNFYPAYHFSKIYGDIALKSCKHYSLQEGRWIEGPGYKWEDLTEELHGTFQFPQKSQYTVPSTFSSIELLIGTCILYAVLTWYCDHVFPNNRGNSDSPFFFLTNNYWKCLENRFKRKHSSEIIKPKAYDYKNINPIDTVTEEKERVLSNAMNQTEVKGLRISRLSKTYNKYPFGIKSLKDFEALKDVYLEVDDGELLGVLGHNGAGKSTMIGVLTGIFEPTAGTAEILNYDIRTNMDSIRSLMGVCPQFDILWDELTVEEHLTIFSKIKNIPNHLIGKEIDSKLEQVELLEKKHSLVSTLSGGQKRRVSLAISAIGDPKIIILDEPTTGMDPKTRRKAWKMIQGLKKNRVMILTTHAMEEADALSDRIAVMVKGKLSCIGTPLYLKNNFGDGYKLKFLSDSNLDEMQTLIKKILPSSKIISVGEGSLTISIQMSNMEELNIFFRIIENKTNDDDSIRIRSMIKNWGLSHSTLEEVFMKITRENNI